MSADAMARKGALGVGAVGPDDGRARAVGEDGLVVGVRGRSGARELHPRVEDAVPGRLAS